jgi:hypothetical protein
MASKKVVHYNAYIDHETQRPVVEEIPGVIRADGRVHLKHTPHGDFSLDQTFARVFLISSPESAVDELCRNVQRRLDDCCAKVSRLEEQLVHIVSLKQELAAADTEDFSS